MLILCSVLFAVSAAAVAAAIYFLDLTKFSPYKLALSIIIPAITAFLMMLLYNSNSILSFITGTVFYISTAATVIAVNRGKIKKSIYLLALDIALMSVVQSLIIWVLGEELFYANWFTASGFNLVYSSLILITNKRRKYFVDYLKLIPNYIYVIIVICVFLAGGVLPGFMYENTNAMAMTQTMIILLILSLVIVISLLIILSIRHSFHKSLSELLQHEMNSELRHYQSRMTEDNKIRRFRHDYKNHLLCINSLAKAGQVDELIEYIDELSISMLPHDNAFDSGNYIADAIIKEKYELAVNNQIRFEFDGNIPNAGISNVDMCVILSNALDNAIEACMQCDGNDREISLTCKTAGQGFFIKLENTVEKNIDTRALKSVKTDKINHGFGLINIKAAVEKYNGIVETSCENNFFTLKIKMNLRVFQESELKESNIYI